MNFFGGGPYIGTFMRIDEHGIFLHISNVDDIVLLGLKTKIETILGNRENPTQKQSIINPKSKHEQIHGEIIPELPLKEKYFSNVNEKSQEKVGPKINNNSIFIVHGHDNEVKQTIARFVEKMGFKAIILHEQANKGKHLLQKLHDNSEVGYAIVLLTPDDEGKSNKEKDYKARARQNVIFELGYFIAALGDARVCAIHKPSVEIPTDYKGIAFIEYDERGAWRMEIQRELKSLGYVIDFENAL